MGRVRGREGGGERMKAGKKEGSEGWADRWMGNGDGLVGRCDV